MDNTKPSPLFPWSHLGTLQVITEHSESLRFVSANDTTTSPASSCSRSETSLTVLSDAGGINLSVSTDLTEYTGNEPAAEPPATCTFPSFGVNPAKEEKCDSDLLGLTLPIIHDGGQPERAAEVDDSDLIGCDSGHATPWRCDSTTGSPRITLGSGSLSPRSDEGRDGDASSDGLASVRVGIWNEIYRWEKGSTLTYNIDTRSFLGNCADATLVEESTRKAITAWREIDVTFRQVPSSEPSTFTFQYGGAGSNGDLAVAFLPHEYPRKRNVVVYDNLLAKEYRPYAVNVLSHELGHLLGLRHEFQTPVEIQHPSVQIGHDNSASVMNYFPDLSLMVVGDRDIEETKILYSLPRSYKGWTVKVVKPLRV
ncbi:hypothetical protein B0T25DRAFT_265166 [Lasiosphaeria hispida]|uniref:Peptidase metallopeptidase domain-containing protein n=1 Tax=Lasiosphaeria hispida TaxID=260671 RepID=A0AAJ0HA87_9PEZI|nr:hypothetical protein B0T25DRAFT_265166 [Lasiosphaeria hispida]